MTKEALRINLEAGKTMDALFHYRGGQECLIFKAEQFAVGEEIIYIPDIYLNEIPMDRPLSTDTEIEDIISICYTGNDFVDECGGDMEMAKRLFSYCDWQHPSSALPEIDCWEDNSGAETQKIKIVLFQAPYAALMEQGRYQRMLSLVDPYKGDVPAEYYLPVFNGEIDYSDELPDGRTERDQLILEHVFHIFNTSCPAGYCGRSCSVGDVARIEGRHYLCTAAGFTPISFTPGARHRITAAPSTIELTLPSGTRLRASAYQESEYPCINIDIVDDNGELERVCFVEHNPGKAPGLELCIGVYCSSDEDTVFYDSYMRPCTVSD